jgi:hypothetical protein
MEAEVAALLAKAGAAGDKAMAEAEAALTEQVRAGHGARQAGGRRAAGGRRGTGPWPCAPWAVLARAFRAPASLQPTVHCARARATGACQQAARARAPGRPAARPPPIPAPRRPRPTGARASARR